MGASPVVMPSPIPVDVRARQRFGLSVIPFRYQLVDHVLHLLGMKRVSPFDLLHHDMIFAQDRVSAAPPNFRLVHRYVLSHDKSAIFAIKKAAKLFCRLN